MLAIRPYGADGAEGLLMSFALSLFIGIGWTLSRHRIAVAKAQADELTFLLAPVVQHSIEDAARRVGC